MVSFFTLRQFNKSRPSEVIIHCFNKARELIKVFWLMALRNKILASEVAVPYPKWRRMATCYVLLKYLPYSVQMWEACCSRVVIIGYICVVLGSMSGKAKFFFSFDENNVMSSYSRFWGLLFVNEKSHYNITLNNILYHIIFFEKGWLY